MRHERVEEKNCETNKRYNRLLQAIDKCNEWADTTQRLQLLIEEQCRAMQTLENQCKEMVDNIEESTCNVLFIRSRIGCLLFTNKDNFDDENVSFFILLHLNLFLSSMSISIAHKYMQVSTLFKKKLMKHASSKPKLSTKAKSLPTIKSISNI